MLRPLCALTALFASCASARNLTSPWLGANLGAASLIKAPWSDASFLDALPGLYLGTLRYPSGTFGNYFDWTSGNMLPPYAPLPYNSTLSDFAAAINASHARPILMLNLLTSTLSHQLAMLHAAAALGLDIGHVELGNEFYLPARADYAAAFPDGAAYGRVVNEWVAAIWAFWPLTRIAIVTTPSDGCNGARCEGWNAGVFSALNITTNHALCATMHEYHPSGVHGCAGYSLNAAMVATALAEPRAIAAAFKEAVDALPPVIGGVWITEWSLDMNGNAPSKEPLIFGTWASGMWAAELAILFLTTPRAALLDKHALIGDASAGALFDTIDGLNVVGAPTPPLPTGLWAPSASGAALALVANASTGATSVEVFDSPPLVYALFTGGAGGPRGVIVNAAPHATPLPSTLASFTWLTSTFAEATAAINASSALHVQEGSVGAGTALPRFSVTLLG